MNCTKCSEREAMYGRPCPEDAIYDTGGVCPVCRDVRHGSAFDCAQDLGQPYKLRPDPIGSHEAKFST